MIARVTSARLALLAIVSTEAEFQSVERERERERERGREEGERADSA